MRAKDQAVGLGDWVGVLEQQPLVRHPCRLTGVTRKHVEVQAKVQGRHGIPQCQWESCGNCTEAWAKF